MPFHEMEAEFMLDMGEEFAELRDTFSSQEAFLDYILENLEEFVFAMVPEVVGYSFTDEDIGIYLEAYSRSSNPTNLNETLHSIENALSIKGLQFPGDIPVLSFVAGNTASMFSEWITAHSDQLDLTSGNHVLIVLGGASHYLWYTHLEPIVEAILTWQGLR
jgi:hypothetical protein